MNGKQLRNSILQQAIQGRLAPQNPDDEPVSVLLERIRKEKARLVKEKKIKKDKNESVIFRGDDGSWYERWDSGREECIDEEIPFKVPESWMWCRLGNIGDWGAGATPSKANMEFYSNGIIPWLKTGELNDDIVTSSEVKISAKAFEMCSLRLCNIGDVLIAMYGATIGKVAIAGIELTTNQACCACTPFFIYNYYLFYFLMASRNDFIKIGEGGAQPNISKEKIINYLFPLPPLSEQHRIVEKIEELLPYVNSYDKTQIELNSLDASLPERLRKSVLQEAIQGHLVPQDPNDEPASVLLERIREEKAKLVKEKKIKKDKDESVIFRGDDGSWYERWASGREKCIDEEIPFDIPDNWEWCRLNNIANIIGGFAFKSINYSMVGVRVIRISDFDENDFINDRIVRHEFNDKLSRFLIKEKDILIAMTGGTVGKSFYVQFLPEKMLLNQRVAIIRTLGDISFYIRYIIQSPFVQNIITEAKNSTNDNVSMDDIYQFLIPLPPLAEQHRIVDHLEEILPQLQYKTTL